MLQNNNTLADDQFEDEKTQPEEQQNDTKQSENKANDLVIQKDVYVSWPKFLSIKYGIEDLSALIYHEQFSVIHSTMIKSAESQKRLEAQNRISDDVDQEAEESIRAYESYVTYTEDTKAVVLSLNQLFLVAYKTLYQFKYKRQNLMITCSHVENQQEISLTLNELIVLMAQQYTKVGKKLYVQDPLVDGALYIERLAVANKYAAAFTPVPPHLSAFKGLQEQMTTEVMGAYVAPETIDIVARTILNSQKPYCDPTNKPVQIMESSRSMPGTTLHSLTDVLNGQFTQEEEFRSIANKMESHAKSVQAAHIYDTLNETVGKEDNILKQANLDKICGAFNVGWISVPKMVSSDEDNKKRDIANAYVRKFRDKPHLFYYLRNPCTFFFVQSESGRRYQSGQQLKVFLDSLPKLFHYMQILAAGAKKVVAQYDEGMKRLMTAVATVACGKDTSIRVSLANQYKANYFLWIRVVVIDRFPPIKLKYMPMNIVTQEGAYVDGQNVEEKAVSLDEKNFDFI